MKDRNQLKRNMILIIDDDAINQEMLTRVFSSKYDVEGAVNGLEGLEKLEANKERICAILLDVSMPVMDGMDFLRIINSKGIQETIPVFFVTASTEYDVVKEGYELGAMDVITKPVIPFVIFKRVENIIELYESRENLSKTVIGQAKQIKEIEDNMDSLHRKTIETLASAIKFGDDLTDNQSEYWNINKREIQSKNFPEQDTNNNELDKSGTFNREVVDVLLLMAAVQSAYDMIICVNLTKNSYYMIDYDRFLTHCAGYDGVFDELILAGGSAVPESHRDEFINTFNRNSLIEAYKSGKKTVSLEHPQYSDDGVLHMVSTSVLFVEDPKTDDLLEITLSCYIDEEWEERENTKKILSDALIVAEKANKAKSDFLSRMSHDIRTPLNAIMGMATIIGANCEDANKIKECVNKISVASKHLLELINNILDFSKIESGNVSITEKDFDIRNLAEEVKTIIEERAKEKNQKLEVFVSEEVENTYIGDEFRIRQILINLLDNAYKYTAEGGEYSLRINVGNSTNTHHYLTLEVKDNGVGISDAHIDTMFSPFVQCGDDVGSDGVGLGLSITRNIVHLMNGKMDVESEPGKGTTFIIELPVKVSDATKKELCAHKETAAFYDDIIYSGQKILIAEDNELNQEIIKTILEMKNLKVDIAGDGQSVVNMFVNSEPEEYLVVFMDIAMPVMDGYEAAKCIRKSSHSQAETIPIYALTANAFYSDVVDAKASGMNGHVSKPIDFNEISKILSEAIDARETEKG